MMKELLLLLLTLCLSATLTAVPKDLKKLKKPDACHPYYCSDHDWDHNLKRFDPESIRWPLHYTGELKKDIIDGGRESFDVIFADHKNDEERLALSAFRVRSECPDPQFLARGIAMDEAFICQEFAQSEPSWESTGCSLIGSSVEDQLLSSGGCSKKLRHWTVIDWCTWEPNGGVNAEGSTDDYVIVKNLVDETAYYAFDENFVQVDGYYKFTQVIKVLDVTPPKLLSCADVMFDLSGDCEADVVLSNTVTDLGDCGGSRMNVSMEVYDVNASLVYQERFITYRDQEFSKPIGSLSTGDYYVYYTISDGCSNYSHCNHMITVIDQGGPSIFCIESLSSSISVEHGLTIWAKDFVHKADNTCSDGALTYSFFQDSIANSISFDCETGQGFHDLQIYVSDELGNQSFCPVKLFVADNFSCEPDAMAFGGVIVNRFNAPIGEVEVGVNSSLESYPSTTISDDQGQYYLSGVSTQKSNMEIVPNMSNNATSGLDGFDLIRLSRHIYGVNRFDDVLEYAAADMNNDAVIDMKDYWSLAAVLYGVQYELVDYKPWKFIDQRLINRGINRASKLTIPIELSTNRHRYDLLGLESGDVDFSWTNQVGATKRSAEERVVFDKTGNSYSWNQLSELEDITLIIRNISVDEFVKLNPEFSFAENAEVLPIDQNSLLIALHDQSYSGLSSLELSSSSTIDLVKSSAFLGDGKLLVKHTIEIRERTSETNTTLSPNPFTDFVCIRLSPGEKFLSTIEVFDVMGRSLSSIDASGENQTTVNLSETDYHGIVLVNYSTNYGNSTQRVLRLR